MSPSPVFVSVFDRVFDLVIYGAGLAGFAAARKFVAEGRSLLLVDALGDVLWECGRSFENSADASEPLPEWDDWLEAMRVRKGANPRWFEPALAEILAADYLNARRESIQTLFYAPVVAVDVRSGLLSAMTVATKSGFHCIRGRQWIDASETGQLARLCDPELRGRAPSERVRSVILHGKPPSSGAAFDALSAEFGRECLPSVRESERRVRWRCDEKTPWHLQARALISRIRELAGDSVLISHFSFRDYPIYAENPAAPAEKKTRNLTILSPGLRSEGLELPSERFALGLRCELPEAAVEADSVSPSPLAARGEEFDVVVAGGGTAGAIAALAAARNGARTLVLDLAPWPGGVGAVGGISGYFHGAPGGLQTEVDDRVRILSGLMNGSPSGPKRWHHAAKSLVLLEMFEEAGVTFWEGALACAVECQDGTMKSLQVATPRGLLTVRASAFVDSTGDGDICALAGAKFRQGRSGDGLTLAFSQPALWLGEDEHRWQVRLANYDAGWVVPDDPEDLTRARLEGVAQYLRPGWDAPDRPMALAPVLGLRQSRQIETDGRVELHDLTSGRRFADTIGAVETVADTHAVDYEFESDEAAFYYWTCRAFRHSLRSEMPYRMLLPRGLVNVWIACRAAGVSQDAFFGLRMQREMQRLGEAAGTAAALCVRGSCGSREVNLSQLQDILTATGAIVPSLAVEAPSLARLLEKLDAGLPGIHLWEIYFFRPAPVEEVALRLGSADSRTSFQAAAILAMWGNDLAEDRLVASLAGRERGPSPEEHRVPGPHGQCIDVPFWLQALVLLRRVGSRKCLPELRRLAGEGDHPFNVRTCLALTLESLVNRSMDGPVVRETLSLLNEGSAEAFLSPSRSLWRTLHGEEQKLMPHLRGADTRQDLSWQLHVVLGRIRAKLGISSPGVAHDGLRDRRAFVRRAFSGGSSS